MSRGKDRNWGLRRRVPDALRKIIGKGEIWISYGPVSYADAMARHDAERAKVTRAFAEARRRLKAGNTAPATIEELAAPAAPLAPASALVEPTLNDVQAAIRFWFRRQEEVRMAEPVPSDPNDQAAGLDNFPEDVADLSGEQGRRIAERQLPAIMGAYGFDAPAARDVQRIAVQMVQRAIVEGERRDWDRWRGITEAAHDPAFAAITVLSPPPPEPKAGLTFGALMDQYLTRAERTGRSPKTLLKYKGFARVLKEIVGEAKAAAAVDRAECRRVQDVLRTLPPNAIKRWPGLSAPEAAEKAQAEGIEPMHPNSVGNHVEFLASVFKFGVEEQLIEKNPAKRLDGTAAKGIVAPANGEKRRPFTIDELRAVFSSPLYVGCQDDGNGYDKPGPNHPRRGRFWVPLVSLFGGLRLNEACQLRAADVMEVAGVPVIHVRAEAEGARLKTKSADRRVPIHSELVKIGFLQHAEKMREAGEDRLFPDLPVGKMGTYADPFSKWFGRFLTKANVTAPGVVFHSFRHAFADAMREADIPRELRLVIGGWSTKSEGVDFDYGHGDSLRRLALNLGRIGYPGLDLSHLYAQTPAVRPAATVRHRPPHVRTPTEPL